MERARRVIDAGRACVEHACDAVEHSRACVRAIRERRAILADAKARNRATTW
jgi:hypothetical protein